MSDLTRVFLPSALLIGSALYFRPSLLPAAIAVAAVLGGIAYITQPERGGRIVDRIEELVVKLTLTIEEKKDEVVSAVKSSTTSSSSPSPKGVLNPETFQEFPISKKTQISHNTAIYRFSLPTPDSILGLPIGQHISLAATLDVTDPKTGKTETKQVVRSYTPISSDVHPGYFDLLIKSYPTGNISRHLGTLDVGDKMLVRGPKGAMVYSPNMTRHFGMIAGGTGITPMLQIINAILRGRKEGDRTQVDLIFANVDEKDILMREELEELAGKDEGFRVYYVLNNPPEGWKGGVGFVTAEMIKEKLPAPSKDARILMCGPPPMVSAIKKATESLGFDKARPVSKLDDQVFSF